ALKVSEQLASHINLTSQKETKVGRDLIIPAAAGVQLVAGIANRGDKLSLDEAVDIFRFAAIEVARLFARAEKYLAKRRGDIASLFFVQNTCSGESLGVCEAAFDVGFDQSPVKCE